MLIRLPEFLGWVYLSRSVKNPFAKLWTWMKAHPIWSKVAADLITRVLRWGLSFAVVVVAIAWPTHRKAVVDYFSWLGRGFTYVPAWEYLWTFLSYRVPAPVWSLLVIGGAACLVIWKLLLALPRAMSLRPSKPPGPHTTPVRLAISSNSTARRACPSSTTPSNPKSPASCKAPDPLQGARDAPFSAGSRIGP